MGEQLKFLRLARVESEWREFSEVVDVTLWMAVQIFIFL
jgi:hypothetical protein